MPPDSSSAQASARTGGRRLRKRERTRRSIFDAAMALFAERGFDAVTVEQICDAADVGRGTFFLHFPTKAGLIFEATARMTADLRELLAEPGPTALSDLRRVTRFILERFETRREVMEPMFREALGRPAGELHAQPEAVELGTLIVELVRRGQREGEFRADVLAELVATSYMASCSTIASVAMSQGVRDFNPFIAQYLELLLGGLMRDARSTP
jgi:AcrR family transcriptional regulator